MAILLSGLWWVISSSISSLYRCTRAMIPNFHVSCEYGTCKHSTGNVCTKNVERRENELFGTRVGLWKSCCCMFRNSANSGIMVWYRVGDRRNRPMTAAQVFDDPSSPSQAPLASERIRHLILWVWERTGTEMPCCEWWARARLRSNCARDASSVVCLPILGFFTDEFPSVMNAPLGRTGKVKKKLCSLWEWMRYMFHKAMTLLYTSVLINMLYLNIVSP